MHQNYKIYKCIYIFGKFCVFTNFGQKCTKSAKYTICTKVFVYLVNFVYLQIWDKNAPKLQNIQNVHDLQNVEKHLYIY